MSEMDKLKELSKKLPTLVPILFPSEKVKVRVLVVENNERVRSLLSGSLEYFGGSCMTVTNGKEAMECLEKDDYDVLLGHIVVSEEIGVGVLRKFQEKNPKAMIVIMSGSDDHLKEYGKYLSILALPFGFYDFVKPVEVDTTVHIHTEVKNG
jgi:DNA-binding NtrC family response regulator